MATERIVIVGGPRTGKSWLAREMATKDGSFDRYCGDPQSKVKEPFGGVTYLPEGLAIEDESTRWIVMNWFAKPGPWICEGWCMARALRKYLQVRDEIESYYGGGLKMKPGPCDRIIVLENQRDDCDVSPGQRAMHKGVMRVWASIVNNFPDSIVEYR